MPEILDKIYLPSLNQSQNVPTRPMLTTLDVALAMTINIVICQHTGIDQIPLFLANGHLPKTSTIVAEKIIEKAKELREIIDNYFYTIERENKNVSPLVRR